MKHEQTEVRMAKTRAKGHPAGEKETTIWTARLLTPRLVLLQSHDTSPEPPVQGQVHVLTHSRSYLSANIH